MLAPDRLAQSDPEVWNAIRLEYQRQEEHVELIASENYASAAVLAAQGTALTNKYAEGYPGKRYYGGCAFVDVAEHLAIERAKLLVRRAVRQRAAALGLAGEPGGVPRVSQARRHDPRHVARPRRAPVARRRGQFERQALPRGVLRPRPRRGARLRRDGEARARAQPARHRRRRLGVLAGHRLAAPAPHRRRDRRHPDGGYRALRGPGRRRALSEPGRGRRRRHQHHAQDAARAARRHAARRCRARDARSTRRCFPECRAGR